MSKVIVDITMSLDGYIAGPNVGLANPLGEEGERLHAWLFDKKTETDKKIIDELVHSSGAVITGNRTYETAIDEAWEAKSPFSVPAFVLAHTEPVHVVDGFTFVTSGLADALAKAREVAGSKNVWVMGGANVVQQFISSGYADELHIHIAPLFLGDGTKLFENVVKATKDLEIISTVQTPAAIHLRFRPTK